MIDELKKNIETEIAMLREVSNYRNRLDSAAEEEIALIKGAIRSLRQGMKIINSTIPEILTEITSTKNLPTLPTREKAGKDFENVTFKREGNNVDVLLKRGDKEKFFKELNISEQFIKKIKSRGREETEKFNEFKASRGYLKLANRYYLNRASTYAKKGYFKDLLVSLRRANIDILFESYVALILFSVVLSFFASLLLTVLLLVFQTTPIFPYFEFRDANWLITLLRVIWIPIAIPILTFLTIYYYPSTEKKSIGKKIDQELPFAVIHMSAISGSGIEPSEIFRIIGLSSDYPYLRMEIRKVLNQINLYGYDLTTALNNAAKSAPSENLADLFSGLSTSISSGAQLRQFFEKRAESLLLGYRLEREKYTRLVETFLDIYISIVIAAPMIFLLLLVMMAISGIGVSLTPVQISLLAVFTISILNLAFLVFLHVKQPSY